MSRCKCCNRELKAGEVIWYPKENRHEELCSECRVSIITEMRKMGWSTSHIPDEDDDGDVT